MKIGGSRDDDDRVAGQERRVDQDGRADGDAASEAELIRLAQRGSRAAFAQLFAAYQGRVYKTACLITRDRHLAEDLTQEAFVRAYLALGRCDADRPFAPWLFRILINLCRTAVGRRGRQVIVAALPDEPAPDAGLPGTELKVVVWHALLALEPIHRDVLMLRYYQDFTDPQIAEALDLPLGTVKSRLHKARRLLERKLADDGDLGAAAREVLS